MQSYDFPTVEYRAQCLRVIDGDTADLFVDRGNHDYSRWRVRLHGVQAPELRAKSDEDRIRAKEAREALSMWLQPAPVRDVVSLGHWPLRVKTFKDPDSFGRWLALVWWRDAEGVEHDVCAELLMTGLAAPYAR